MQKKTWRGLTWFVCALALAACAVANAQTPGVVAGDFNGDGVDDLAIPVPDQLVAGAPKAGAVQIIYSTAAGITADKNKLFHQNKSGMASDAAGEEHFASTLAAGDFDGDGFVDLAIGVPGQSVGTQLNAGAVHVMYGSANGVKPTGSQFWTQDSAGIANKSKRDDAFGTALVAADFDGDGFADLAIGAPGDKVSKLTGAGGVNVIYGSAAGLVSAGNQYWSLDASTVPDAAAADDEFGRVITAGDFNGDGFADLAIDAPGKTVNTFTRAGCISVIYGSAAGLTSAGAQSWNQDSGAILDQAEMSDEFGSSLAAGDFNGDGFDDLACGASEDSVGAVTSAGVVNVIYGSAAGLTDVNNQLWTQDTGTILDSVEPGDSFGGALAAGDFNDDGFCDLAVGVPGENVVAGAVQMILGSAAGLTDVGNKYFDQNSVGMQGGPSQTVAAFGYTLCVGQFNSDDRTDLAIGIPFEDVDGISNAGAVQVLYGHASGTGLGILNNQFWTKNSVGISGDCAENEFFGGL